MIIFGEVSKTYVWRHDYDELGNRMTTLRPDGQRIDWLRYGSGHVHGMMLNLQEFASFERDDLHRENKRYLLNQLEQQTQYDAVGRILQQNITGKSKQNRLYQYDDIGQLIGINDSRKGVSSYTYDPVGRLLRASTPNYTETFAFDPAGNILSPHQSGVNDISHSKGHHNHNHPHKGAARTESHFPAKTTAKGSQTVSTLSPLMGNLLKSFAGTHYDYNERGNLVRKTHNGEVTEYIWDNFNRLRNVKTKHSQNLYYYDALGRRVAKEQVQNERSIDPRGNIKPSKQETQYLWDGDVLAIETVEDTSTHYVFEPHSFKPLAQFKTEAVQGIDTPVYDPHEYRHYAPEVGTFISSDPIKLKGENNMHAYELHLVA